jgi:hypothetical protein
MAPPPKAPLMWACSYGAQIPFQLKTRPGAFQNLPWGACLFLPETNPYSTLEPPATWGAKAPALKKGEHAQLWRYIADVSS